MSVQAGQKPTTRKSRAARRPASYVWSSPAAEGRRMSGAIIFMIVAGLVAAVGMLYLLQTNHVAGLGYEMSRLQEERQAAMVEQQQLQAELARIQAFNRIDRVARQDLGLVPMEDYIFQEVEAPERKDLEIPPDPEPGSSSVWDRLWERISGRGSHESQPGEEVTP